MIIKYLSYIEWNEIKNDYILIYTEGHRANLKTDKMILSVFKIPYCVAFMPIVLLYICVHGNICAIQIPDSLSVLKLITWGFKVTYFW